jgi:hypothetical protein
MQTAENRERHLKVWEVGVLAAQQLTEGSSARIVAHTSVESTAICWLWDNGLLQHHKTLLVPECSEDKTNRLHFIVRTIACINQHSIC